MQTLYLKRYDCFIRYFVRLGDDDLDPIIFLPGLITPALPLFFDLINHPLLQQYPAILINYPGTGISDTISDSIGKGDVFDHHPKAHAEIIVKIIEQEPMLDDGSKFHIMGHSMGGTIGIYLTQIYPKRVISLMMSEANLFSGGGPGTRYVASFTEDQWVEEGFTHMIEEWRIAGKAGDATKAILPAFQQTSDPSAIYLAASQLVELDDEVFELLSDELQEINRHFIYGEKNVPLTLEDAMPDTPQPELLEEVGIITHVVPDAGHMMMVDNLNGYAEILANIIN